jgi:hypothetical protein
VLLLLFGVALGIGGAIVWLAVRWNRQQKSLGTHSHWVDRATRSHRPFLQRPILWLAIRSRDPANVLKALSLSDAAPCSWSDGMAGENRLFIAPPVRGWVLVTGTALPDPAEDVDASFRFLRELSRKLGEVQFFCADRVLHHHAWARLAAGRVVRAYAWAGATLWNQGVKTAAEKALDLNALGYGEEPSIRWGMPDFLAANVEKVPQLAARWSLDPAEVATRMPPHARGIAGRPSAHY